MGIHAEIMAIQRSNHARGSAIVSPLFHKRQRLPDPAQESRDFFNAIFAKNLPAAGTEFSENGATDKSFIKAGGARDKRGRVLPSRIYMLKPYYEDFGGWEATYDYPTAGWSELATQALMHAGGLGHMSQKVHAHVPVRGSPVLAVEIEPGVHRMSNVYVGRPRWGGDNKPFGASTGHGKVNITDQVRADAAKLAAIDFLTNNQDRHDANLLFRPLYRRGATDVESILAIDHGRSFHYKQGNRFSDDDGMFADHLFNYMYTPGFMHFGLRENKNVKLVMHAIADWWKGNGKKVRAELTKQLKGIKHDGLADHISIEFGRRADALDKMVKTLKKRGHTVYNPRGVDKKAFAELRVSMAGHVPEDEWAGGYDRDWEDPESCPGDDICSHCGECNGCNPHSHDKASKEQKAFREAEKKREQKFADPNGNSRWADVSYPSNVKGS